MIKRYRILSQFVDLYLKTLSASPSLNGMISLSTTFDSYYYLQNSYSTALSHYRSRIRKQAQPTEKLRGSSLWKVFSQSRLNSRCAEKRTIDDLEEPLPPEIGSKISGGHPQRRDFRTYVSRGINPYRREIHGVTRNMYYAI